MIIRPWVAVAILLGAALPSRASAQAGPPVAGVELQRTIGELGSDVEFYRLGTGALWRDTLWVSEPTRLLALVDGRIVRTIGKAGDGPGEFRGISTFGFVGNRLWVSDDRVDRLTEFALSGDVVETRRYADLPTLDGYRVNVLLPLPGDAIGIRGSWDAPQLAQGPRPEPVLRFDGSGLDTLLLAESRPYDLGMSGGLMFTQPVTERHHVAWDTRTGRAAVVQQRQDDHAPGHFSVTLFDESGAVLAESTDSFPPQRFREEIVNESLRAFEGSPVFTDEVISRMREATFTPEILPPVRRAQFDSLGRLWVAQQTLEPDSPIRWRVYGLDLAAAFDVYIPYGASVLDASEDAVWTRGVGELDVSVVREWTLVRPG